MLVNYTQSAYFMIFSVSSISYRPTDLSLLKELSKNVGFSNSCKLPSQSAVQKISMSTVEYTGSLEMLFFLNLTLTICKLNLVWRVFGIVILIYVWTFLTLQSIFIETMLHAIYGSIWTRIRKHFKFGLNPGIATENGSGQTGHP